MDFILHLVGGDWNITGLFSHSVGKFIIPIDELIFFRGVGIPPTSLFDFPIFEVFHISAMNIFGHGASHPEQNEAFWSNMKLCPKSIASSSHSSSIWPQLDDNTPFLSISGQKPMKSGHEFRFDSTIFAECPAFSFKHPWISFNFRHLPPDSSSPVEALSALPLHPWERLGMSQGRKMLRASWDLGGSHDGTHVARRGEHAQVDLVRKLVGGDWNIFYLPIYWEYSSQLTFIFFRGVETTNQIDMGKSMENHHDFIDDFAIWNSDFR